jgi:putative inorganic carbon (hco3(-)) transporter
MALTTIAYLVLFCGCVIASVFYHPMVGLMGYLFSYHINPVEQWWGANLPAFVNRYAFILGVATLLGVILQHRKLKYRRLLEGQEILLSAYVLIIAASLLLGFNNPAPELNIIKMAKVTIMLVLAGHIVTTLKRYEILLFLFIISGFYLGVKTHDAPSSLFRYGRFISGIGGSDFSDGNVLSGHFVMILPLLGVLAIKGKWFIKSVCAVSAVFILNGVILIKSRGSFLALAICVPFAFILANKGIKKKVLPYLILGIIGGTALMDPGYMLRMKTIETKTEEMDTSSAKRIYFWKVALQMALDNPLGIGEGNFNHYIGTYDTELANRDTHNTYLRCLAELGFQGLLVLLLLIINAFRMLSKISSRIGRVKNSQSYIWHVYGLRLALIGYLIVAFFISSTYVEDFFWLLMLPMFLKRCVENEETETNQEEPDAISGSAVVMLVKGRQTT